MTLRKLISIGIALIVLSLMVIFFTQDYFVGKIPSIRLPETSTDLFIKKSLTQWGTTPGAVIGEERIYTPFLVGSFYRGRNYQPAWSRDDDFVQAGLLIRALEKASDDGLAPDHYHLPRLKALMATVEPEKKLSDLRHLAELDILLTDAFLTFGCHLSAGCAAPLTMDPAWFIQGRNVDVSSVLEQALEKKQVREALAGLRPEGAAYARLGNALAAYRELLSKGEWPPVTEGPTLRKGDRSERVAELKKRLADSGDLEAGAAMEADLFDDELEGAVISYQKRHGLAPDGVAGRETLDVMNVPLSQRLRQIELNMERLRWISGNPEPCSVVINIADFELDVREAGESVLSMKVVVGKPYWDTPVFSARITSLVLNPAWNVPDSIAKKELLSKIRKEPDYISKQNITVLRGWRKDGPKIDPQTVDWATITPKNLLYRFRQEPGLLNPLGSIKFMLPNKFDVYLHDTPARSLFSKPVRTFSHGCIRIEKPIELAAYVLRNDPGWTREKLLAALKRGKEQTVRISHPVNTCFIYLTAWVDEKGTLQFRNDIYGRDKLFDEALRRRTQ